MKIIPIKLLSDNYSYILAEGNNTSQKEAKEAVVIDPSQASAILDCLEQNKLKLKFILNTHHHYDHTGGNNELKQKTNAKIIASEIESKKIPSVDIKLKENQEFQIFKENSLTTILSPGHTNGHILFWFKKDNIIFTGDTLFSLGIGKLFEGNAQEMHQSLKKIINLPENTLIYPGHEYAFKNLEFNLKIDPQNEELKKYAKKVKENNSKDIPLIPSTLSLELKTNCFLRWQDQNIRKNINLPNAPDWQVLKKLRELKN